MQQDDERKAKGGYRTISVQQVAGEWKTRGALDRPGRRRREAVTSATRME